MLSRTVFFILAILAITPITIARNIHDSDLTTAEDAQVVALVRSFFAVFDARDLALRFFTTQLASFARTMARG